MHRRPASAHSRTLVIAHLYQDSDGSRIPLLSERCLSSRFAKRLISSSSGIMLTFLVIDPQTNADLPAVVSPFKRYFRDSALGYGFIKWPSCPNPPIYVLYTYVLPQCVRLSPCLYLSHAQVSSKTQSYGVYCLNCACLRLCNGSWHSVYNGHLTTTR